MFIICVKQRSKEPRDKYLIIIVIFTKAVLCATDIHVHLQILYIWFLHIFDDDIPCATKDDINFLQCTAKP